jgi:hypothetical protein
MLYYDDQEYSFLLRKVIVFDIENRSRLLLLRITQKKFPILVDMEK